MTKLDWAKYLELDIENMTEEEIEKIVNKFLCID